MRAIRTFRDAEIAVRELHTRVDSLKLETDNPRSSGNTTTTIIREVEVSKPSPADLDVEFVADSNLITHKFIHRFREELWADLFLVTPQMVIKNDAGQWQLLPNVSTGALEITAVIAGNEYNTISMDLSALTSRKIKFDANLDPLVDNASNLGTLTKRWKRLELMEIVIHSIINVPNAGNTFLIIDSGTKNMATRNAADFRTLLDVYAKADVYTKAEVDTLLAGKANASHSHSTLTITGTSGGGVAAHTHTGSAS